MAEMFDYVIGGGGIAAASIGHFLAPHAKVVLLEREEQPGYHSTGRSAALFMEGYGTPQVRALTQASRAFFENPPAGFSEHPLLSPRGALAVASPGQESLLAAAHRSAVVTTPSVELLSPEQVTAMVPVLRRELLIGGFWDRTAADMDVHAIHQGFLRGQRRAGGRVDCSAGVTSLVHARGVWTVSTRSMVYKAPVVINAAGAWADVLGRMAGAQPIGLQPKRRSAFIFAPPAGIATAHWPTVSGLLHDWYFKPDAGMLLGSPANEDPVEPHDVQPEDLDIATAIHRIEEATTLKIRRPTRSWAGLRSFVADGDLVGGFDADVPGFFWLAAQGGYGIQTSAAMGEACAALAQGRSMPDHVAGFGLTAERLSPNRLRQASTVGTP